MAFMRIRSITPSKLSSAPIGIWMGSGLARRRDLICSTQRKKLAPARSILLTNAMRGTPYLFICRHTVSDWGCTPETAQNSATAESSTRSERSTSMVKSTCPGVSMMLMRCSGKPCSMPFQKQVVAAAVMVMPRSCSCSM